MPNTREKLVELLCDVIETDGCSGHCNFPPCYLVKACADHLIANGVTVQKWIPVTERLPETTYKTMVIVCVDGEKSAARWFERTTIRGKLVERFRYPWDVITCENITHWMPLPEPPKGE